jgi:glycerol-3-phosphate acyltransferase PlsY
VNGPHGPFSYYLACSVLGYLTGAIPFGYLIFYAAKGIDIRSVGSGNIGATNVGRQLGFRYFLLVFALDVLKGLLPTLGFPWILQKMGLSPPGDLPVFIALAAILGHNFPVYLGFKGGKGVATSLGALLALDPIACGAATVGFFVIFVLTRYVSLSSIAGALAFVAAYLYRTNDPWNREHRAMTILAVSLAALLLLRHHTNLRRILMGTEPRVPLRRKRVDRPSSDEPAGHVHPLLLVALSLVVIALVAASLWLARNAHETVELTAGPWRLVETHRESTGSQRASRVAFADSGRKLAVMCPRYNNVLLYDITADARTERSAELALRGRPVAMATTGNQILVLERPAGDDKHLKPGWLERFDLEGQSMGEPTEAGYYPDDLAATPNGRHVVVLSSGQGEGDADKPLPAIRVFEMSPDALRAIGRLELEPKDDPARLILSAQGTRALVTLRASNRMVAIDLSDPASPFLAGRNVIASSDAPYLSFSPDGDWIVMPSSIGAESVAMDSSTLLRNEVTNSLTRADYLLFTRPEQAAVELDQVDPRREIGRFPVKGPLNLGASRPSGLAFSPERGILAIATKPGTVHLVSIRSRLDEPAKNVPEVASGDVRPRR